MCLIRKINKCHNKTPSNKKNLFIIVGNKKYKINSGGTNINTKDLPFYSKYGFKNVAFLTNGQTLDLYSIVSLLCQSYDKALKIINRVKMEKLALFLYSKKNLILINEEEFLNGTTNNFLRLLKDYPKHKVLFVGNKKTKYVDSNNCMFVPHPSGQTYAKKPIECCNTYFKYTFKDNHSALSLNDFKVL